ncbi:MAG: DNA translocase FtsK, partial [Oscillospiraceae bacterium]
RRKNAVIDIPLDTAFSEILPKRADIEKSPKNKNEGAEESPEGLKEAPKEPFDEGFIDEENKAHIEEIIRRVQSENSLNMGKTMSGREPAAEFEEAHYSEEAEELPWEKAEIEGNEMESTEEAVEAAEAAEAAEPEESSEEISYTEEEGKEIPPEAVIPQPPPYIYEKPSTDLLNMPKEELDTGDTAQELRENAQRLVDTLQSFGVQTRIVDISRGPAVTRYELQPSAGVKISKITNLADDIALNLAAAGVRIEAPIPNKAAVGIEIPNKIVTFVTLKEVLASPVFENSKSDITVALGRDVSGNVKIADIAKMPHLLIAGATGSGKSVCINSIIMSIIFKSDPKDVKLMLVDPKMVELGVYNGIPHLVVPVVNEAKKAAGVLGWAVTEMLSRYKMFAANGVRDIKSFNKFVENMGEDENTELKRMPHIVIIVDELADLMMAAPRDVEDHICRLAQMARAAGMHLIIATQRPSVDVITGVIKANIPSRIAFAVSSQIDSRTILDMAGAEKLIGQGDMLFYPVGASKPTRVQGCFVSDEEIEKVVGFIKSSEGKGASQYDTVVMEEIEKHVPQEKGSNSQSGGNDDGGDDEIINEAIECVVTNGVASTSFLQRKLKLGYARAARVIDELEVRGVISPYEGSKPRQVLMTKERLAEMKMMKGD